MNITNNITTLEDDDYIHVDITNNIQQMSTYEIIDELLLIYQSNDNITMQLNNFIKMQNDKLRIIIENYKYLF